ncbi:MAG: tRNA(fMet)-specific endonuclease VapC [Halothiobacillaceae bacterium]|jgi:tRNA(fMet)-specific endonuclease VapC|nr:tRNA(fMet)-specific endonuclease VapC [Halothiobacillaceae bacterium]MDY0049956.1 tRNA(fMet)-specific endonuclease VapC [Halothiobacillaceae bacterium]
MLKYMPDTNICLFTLKNKPRDLRGIFCRHASQMCISTVTLMELIYGAEKSSAPVRNLEVIEGFIARLDVLDYDTTAANHTGQIRAELARQGTPIGPYDPMIAGHARSRGLILVSNNRRGFERVEGLRLEDWMRQSPA